MNEAQTDKVSEFTRGWCGLFKEYSGREYGLLEYSNMQVRLMGLLAWMAVYSSPCINSPELPEYLSEKYMLAIDKGGGYSQKYLDGIIEREEAKFKRFVYSPPNNILYIHSNKETIALGGSHSHIIVFYDEVQEQFKEPHSSVEYDPQTKSFLPSKKKYFSSSSVEEALNFVKSNIELIPNEREIFLESLAGYLYRRDFSLDTALIIVNTFTKKKEYGPSEKEVRQFKCIYQGLKIQCD